MKLVIVLALVAVAVARPDGETYSDKFDQFDVDEVTGNKRLLLSYTICFDEGIKCTAEGKEVRVYLPDAIATSCAKCSEKQRELIAKFILAIQEHFPEKFESLRKKHDPEDKHGDELKQFLDKYGKH